MTKGLSIVLPTYNERENIPIVIERISEVLSEALIPFEIIVVDDNSPDGTAEVARGLSKRFNVRVLVREKERGLASAVLHGFSKASFDVVGVTDADGQHPPDALPILYNAVQNGAVYAIGSRLVGGGSFESGLSFSRQVISVGATLLARPLVGFSTRDIMSGFFFARKNKIFEGNPDYHMLGYKILLELLTKRPGKSVEVPINFSYRLHGETKLNYKEILSYLKLLLHLYYWKFSHL